MDRAGINTWDTADVYSNGESEVLVGKAMRKLNSAFRLDGLRCDC